MTQIACLCWIFWLHFWNSVFRYLCCVTFLGENWSVESGITLWFSCCERKMTNSNCQNVDAMKISNLLFECCKTASFSSHLVFSKFLVSCGVGSQLLGLDLLFQNPNAAASGGHCQVCLRPLLPSITQSSILFGLITPKTSMPIAGFSSFPFSEL
jgi:hypothetical protein